MPGENDTPLTEEELALAREGKALISAAAPPTVREPKAVYGLRPIASRGGVVTNETIDRLRDDEAY